MTITIKYAADTSQAQRNIDRVNSSMRTTGVEAGRIRNTLSRLGPALVAGFSITAVTGFARSAARASDEVLGIRNRLTAAGVDANALEASMGRINDIASSTFSDLGDTGALFASIARSAGNIGFNLAQSADVAETFLQAARVSGSAPEDAARGARQFIQALDGGILRAEEFNSINETNVALVRQLESALDIAPGGFRAFVNDGRATAEVILPAILQAQEEINRQADQLQPTFGQAAQTLSNGFTNALADVATFAGEFTNVTGIINDWGQRLNDFFAPEGSQISSIGDIISSSLSDVDFNETLQGMFDALEEAGRSFIQFIADLPWQQTLDSLAQSLIRFNWLEALAGAVTAMGRLAFALAEAIFNIDWERVFVRTGAAFVGTIQNFVNFFADIDWVGALRGLQFALRNIFSSSLNFIQDGFYALANQIIDLLNQFTPLDVNPLSRDGNSGEENVSLLDRAATAFQNYSQSVTDYIAATRASELAPPVAESLNTPIVAPSGSSTDPLSRTVVGAGGSGGSSAVVAQDFADGLIEKFSEAASAAIVTGDFQGFRDTVRTHFLDQFQDFLSNRLQDIFSIEPIRNLLNSFGQVFMNGLQAIFGGGGGGGLFGGLIGAFTGGLGGLFGSLFAFEDGGVVPGPYPGAPVPVLAHAGEIVLNRAQQDNLVGGGGGVGGGIIENVVIAPSIGFGRNSQATADSVSQTVLTSLSQASLDRGGDATTDRLGRI